MSYGKLSRIYDNREVYCLFEQLFNSRCNETLKGGDKMKYEKPVTLAQGTGRMADCNPKNKPSGRPCNPPKPGGR